MKPEEIIEVFKKYGEQGTMYRNDPSSLVPGLYKCKLLELKVKLKDGTNVLIMLPEKSVIDVTNSDSDRYVGFDNTLISPMENIESIEAKWRGVDRVETFGKSEK